MNTLDEVKVAAPTSIKDICTTLEGMPESIYDGKAPDIKTFEQVAEKITTYLTANETIILGAQGEDKKEMLRCLVGVKLEQENNRQLLEACALAKVSLDDFLDASVASLSFIRNLDSEKIKYIYYVNAAMVTLGQKSEEEVEEMKIPDVTMKLMEIRKASPEFVLGSAAFHDETRPVFKYIQKIQFLISKLEPKNPLTGWLSGKSCVIL